MDAFFSFLVEFFIRGLVYGSDNKRVPVFVRLLIITILLGGPAALVMCAGFLAMDMSGIGWGIFCWVVAFVIICLWIFVCYKIIKAKLKPKD